MFSSQGQVSSNIITVLIQQAYKTISGRSVVTARKDGIVGEPLQSYNNFHLEAECRRPVFGFFLMFLGVCPSFTNIILVELSWDGTKDDKNSLKTETNNIRTES